MRRTLDLKLSLVFSASFALRGIVMVFAIKDLYDRLNEFVSTGARSLRLDQEIKADIISIRREISDIILDEDRAILVAAKDEVAVTANGSPMPRTGSGPSPKRRRTRKS